MLCGLLVSSKPFIKNLQVVYTGEWDQDEIIITRDDGIDDVDFDTVWPHRWEKSEVECLSIMLEPLRQLKRVQECEIQLPALVQDHLGLADKVRRCVRAAKDKEPSVEAELLQDWERYLV